MIYVYAILGAPLEADIHGINQERIRWVTRDLLAAAVSDVPAEDFDQEPLNENVRDMAWLGPRAIAHQDVNARLFELADALLPLAFGTVFRDEGGVRELLADQSSALGSRLDKVRGSSEWVVTLHVLREPSAEDVAATSPLVQNLKTEIAASSPGRAHLMRQRLQTLERDEAKRLQSEAAAQVLQALRRVGVDVYREPLPTDLVERPLVRASVLVRRAAEAAFVDEIERLQNRWSEPSYRLLLTGPWPPYRFGGL